MTQAAELHLQSIARQHLHVLMAALPPVVGADHHHPSEPHVDWRNARKNKSAIDICFGGGVVLDQVPIVKFSRSPNADVHRFVARQ
ncbi:MAG TPA: hypothetical protein VNM37_01945 [Candidatus Dormibacteraeota bacterium]|nr:hypothetical protein [Candidatus Dormibacteraeota bacterium]